MIYRFTLFCMLILSVLCSPLRAQEQQSSQVHSCEINVTWFNDKKKLVRNYYKKQFAQNNNQLNSMTWDELTKDCKRHFEPVDELEELNNIIAEVLVQNNHFNQLNTRTFANFLDIRDSKDNTEQLLIYINTYLSNDPNIRSNQYVDLVKVFKKNKDTASNRLTTLAISHKLEENSVKQLLADANELADSGAYYQLQSLFEKVVEQHTSENIKQQLTTQLLDRYFFENGHWQIEDAIYNTDIYPTKILAQQIIELFEKKVDITNTQWGRLSSIYTEMDFTPYIQLRLVKLLLNEQNNKSSLDDNHEFLTSLIIPVTRASDVSPKSEELQPLVVDILDLFVELWTKQSIGKANKLWWFYDELTYWVKTSKNSQALLNTYQEKLQSKANQINSYSQFNRYIQLSLLLFELSEDNQGKQLLVDKVKQKAQQILNTEQFEGFKEISTLLYELTNQAYIKLSSKHKRDIFNSLILKNLTTNTIQEQLIEELSIEKLGDKQKPIENFPLTVWFLQQNNYSGSYFKLFFDHIDIKQNPTSNLPWLILYYSVKARIAENNCLWRTSPNSIFFDDKRSFANTYPLIWIKLLDNKQPYCSSKSYTKQTKYSQLNEIVDFINTNLASINSHIKSDANIEFQEHLQGVGRNINQTSELIYWLNSVISVYEWTEKNLIKDYKITVNYTSKSYPLTVETKKSLRSINPTQFDTQLRLSTLKKLLELYKENANLQTLPIITSIATYGLSLPTKTSRKKEKDDNQDSKQRLEVLNDIYEIFINHLQQHYRQNNKWQDELLDSFYIALKLKGHIQPDISMDDITAISVSNSQHVTYQERNIQAAIISLFYNSDESQNQLKGSIEKRFELLKVPNKSERYYNYLPYQVANLKWLLGSIDKVEENGTCQQNETCKADYSKKLYLKAKHTIDLQISNLEVHSNINSQERLVCTLFWLKSNKDSFKGNNDNDKGNYTNDFLDINVEIHALLNRYSEQAKNENKQTWLDRKFDCEVKSGQYFATNGLTVLQQSTLNRKTVVTSNQVFRSFGDILEVLIKRFDKVKSNSCAKAMLKSGLEQCRYLGIEIPEVVKRKVSFLDSLKLSVSKDWKENESTKINWTEGFKTILKLTETNEEALGILLEISSLQPQAQNRLIKIEQDEKEWIYSILHSNFQVLSIEEQKASITNMLSSWRNSYMIDGIIQALIADHMPTMIERLIKGHDSLSDEKISSCDNCIWQPVYQMQAQQLEDAIDPPHPRAFMELTQWWHQQNQPFCSLTGYNKLFILPSKVKQCKAHPNLAAKDKP